MVTSIDGSLKALEERAKIRLQKEGFSTNAGSVARLLVSIVNSEIEGLYSLLNEYHVLAFLSTSSGTFLDSIGMLVNCKRKNDEEDNEYKDRISKQILVVASSNETAIRLAALSVEGVQDISLKRFSHGAGTFSIIVIPEVGYSSEVVLAGVYEAVKETVGFGIKFSVDTAILDEVKLEVKLILDDSVDEFYAEDIKMATKENIKKYINSLSISDYFIINELTQRIMETNENIINYVCIDFKVNNNKAMFIDQSSNWASRFIISKEPNAIIVK